MPNDDSFFAEVIDRFSLVDSVTSRKMFGGHGIFHNGLMIALIADNELYLKGDKQSEHWFKEANLPAFSYQKADGKVFSMSYYLASESFFEEEDDTRLWTSRAIDAALRAPRKPKIPKKPRVKKSAKTTAK